MEIAFDFSFELYAINSPLSHHTLLFLKFLCTTFSLLCICVTVRVRNGGCKLTLTIGSDYKKRLYYVSTVFCNRATIGASPVSWSYAKAVTKLPKKAPPIRIPYSFGNAVY
jgi:hypothetical protein